ncbi:phosphoribosylformylglycinamidine cyclo-ligase [Gemmatimonadota bacterium]
MTEYKEAGVDLRSAESVKEQIAAAIRTTFGENVLTAGGEFGGVYQIPGSDLSLVASVDGVGTKLKVAVRANKHDTIGQDLVNHCVNDVAVMGARPALFLDYLAIGQLKEKVVLEIISGLVRGCQEHSVALIAGETAQMPDIYKEGEYDLAGTIVGFLHPDDRLLKPGIGEGDLLIGVVSNGLHTNGYSLARKIVFEMNDWDVHTHSDDLAQTWGEELLRVHRSYLNEIRSLMESSLAKAFAHITGGGIPGNLSRIIPEDLTAEIARSAIAEQAVFKVLQEAGNVADDEMYQVFNMGIGLIAVCSSEDETTVLDSLGDSAMTIGKVVGGAGNPRVTIH